MYVQIGIVMNHQCTAARVKMVCNCSKWDERDEKNRYEALSMGIEREENDILLLLQGMGFYGSDHNKSTYSRHRKLGSAPVYSISSFTERVVRVTYDAIQLDELY